MGKVYRHAVHIFSFEEIFYFLTLNQLSFGAWLAQLDFHDNILWNKIKILQKLVLSSTLVNNSNNIEKKYEK